MKLNADGLLVIILIYAVLAKIYRTPAAVFEPCHDFAALAHTSPGIDTRYKGPTDFSVSPERHWQSGVNGIVKVNSQADLPGSNPRPLGRQSYALTTEPLHPRLSKGGK